MQQQKTSDRLARRVLVLGWDAADWNVIDPLFAAGRMPNLQKLVSEGTRANLGTLDPKLSPLLWTSIATGKTADKHGILNFVEPKPEGDGIRISQSTTRKTKAVWNILMQSGLRTNVIGWYASHPAEPVNGHIVSNLLHEGCPGSPGEVWPMLPGTVYPDSLTEAIAANRQHYKTFPSALMHAFIPKYKEVNANDKRLLNLTKLMSYAISIETATHTAMEAGDWDATFVFFDAIDTVGHHFMQYRSPRMGHVSEREVRMFGEVMDRVYEWHDEALGRLIQTAGEKVTVLLLSDHGFHTGLLRPVMENLPPERRMELESSWHRPYGVFMASGKGIIKDAMVGPASILDLTPTVLSLLGLKTGEDMDGRVLSEILEPGHETGKIASWDDMEGDAGLHPDDLRNDPVESAASIQQLIDLGYLAAIPENTRDQVDLVRRESLFNLAVSLMARKKYEPAVKMFHELWEEKPDNLRYAMCLAQCQAGLEMNQAAIDTLNKIRVKEPRNTECLLMLSHVLASTGDLNGSIEAGARVEKLAGASFEFGNNLASLALTQKRYSDAVKYAEKAKRANPGDPIAHILLARAKLAMGNFEETAEHALDALDITQAIPEAHCLLGLALAWLDDPENAYQSLRFAAQYDKSSPEVFRALSIMAQVNGDIQEASGYQQHIDEIISLYKKDLLEDTPFGPADLAKKYNLSAI